MPQDAPFHPDMLPTIERFFRTIHPNLMAGRNVYDEVFEDGWFFPLQRKKELAEMMRTAREIKPVTVCEIGADKGGGLYHWCQIASVKKVIGCEIRGTPYGETFEYHFPDIEFCWTDDSRSLTTLEKVGKFLKGDKIDVLFIDGDKSRFLDDFDTYLSVMNPNGIVFMHDVQDTPTRLAFDAVKRRGYQTRLVIDTSEYYELTATGVSLPRSSWEGWLLHWQGRSCGVGVIYLGTQS